MKTTGPAQVELDQLPGHYIRRLQQIAVAIFLQENEVHGVTPVQFAALHTVASIPHIDQRSLARSIGFDTSTIAGVIDRLEGRGLLQRNASAHDRRVRQLSLTAQGLALLNEMEASVLNVQNLILKPLPKAERTEFMRMLRVLVEGNNDMSRAPSMQDN